MAVRKIIRMGHPNLRVKAEPVSTEEFASGELRSLVDDMVDTLQDYGGVGLAAPQIDVQKRLAIIEIANVPETYGEQESTPLTVFVNPKITIFNDAEVAGNWEGCLSVPGLRGYVERPQHLRVDYQDLDGNPQQFEAQGFMATVCQHEFDHLDGVLYIDHITDSTKLGFEEELVRYGTPD